MISAKDGRTVPVQFFHLFCGSLDAHNYSMYVYVYMCLVVLVPYDYMYM